MKREKLRQTGVETSAAEELLAGAVAGIVIAALVCLGLLL